MANKSDRNLNKSTSSERQLKGILKFRLRKNKNHGMKRLKDRIKTFYSKRKRQNHRSSKSNSGKKSKKKEKKIKTKKSKGGDEFDDICLPRITTKGFLEEEAELFDTKKSVTFRVPLKRYKKAKIPNIY